MNTEQRILRQLSEREPLDVAELASVLEDHPMTVEVACDRLHKRGRVRLIGSGRYRLAESDTAHPRETNSSEE
ncbi:transcriptional regulator [Halostagnicola bangensis]